MPSKTKTTTAADESRAALADATERRARLRQQRDDAQTALAGAKGQLRRGDESITVESLSRLTIELERADALAAAAERAVKAAKRNLRADTPDLAEALAEDVLRALDVPVTVQTEAPTEAPDDLPVAVLVQTRPSSPDLIEGTLSGEVQLHYLRTKHHSRPSADAIERALDDAGVRVTVSDNGADDHGDVFGLDVRSAWSGVPVVEGVAQEWRVRRFGTGIASGIARSMQREHLGIAVSGVRMGSSGTTGQTLATVNAEASDCRLTDERTDSDGIRRRTIETTIEAVPGRGQFHTLSSAEFRDRMMQAVEDQAGTCAPALGRVESATVLSFDPAQFTSGATHGGIVRARFVFVSRAAR